jgi:peptidoglycan/xylan/chitin deacetylase (PgdA/CDA1 family)
MTIRATAPRVPILMYHSISYCENPFFRRFTVTPERLEEQLDYLSTHGYTPLTVSDYIQRVAGAGENTGENTGQAQVPPRPVVLTFDDGYADFYTAALPLLRQYQATATLYIVTGYVGGTSGWMQREGEADRPLLNWGQIREIAASAVECGAHTQTHRPLDALSAAECRQEIEDSYRLVAEQVAAPRSFAYPFGYYSRAVRALVQQAGYTSACAVRYAQSSRHDDRFALSRLIVTADTDLPSFEKLLLSGGQQPEAAYLRLRSAAWERVRRSRQMLHRHV